MRSVFADSLYWIALMDPRDAHHQSARSASQEVAEARLITTDSVFSEVLASLRSQPQLRQAAVNFFRELIASPNVEVVRQHAGLFNRALDLYEDRPDKAYSLVDCLSMVVMQDYGIEEVLTADRDFEREGFVRLMRNPSED